MLFRLSVAFLTLAGWSAVHAAPITYNLSLDTSHLAATSTDYQFDFVISGTAGNKVTIGNPNFGTGSLVPGQPTAITLTSSPSNPFVNQPWLFVPGNHVSFTLSITTDIGPLPGSGPDQVEIFLEDIQGDPFSTNDPDQVDALFRLNLTGGADVAEFFHGTQDPINGLTFTQGGTGSTGSTGGGAVPEPASTGLVALTGAGAAVLGILRRRRK